MKSGVQRFVFCYCFACDSKIIYSNLRIEILGEFFEVSIFDSNCYFILIYNLCTFLQAISWTQKINNTAFGNRNLDTIYTRVDFVLHASACSNAQCACFARVVLWIGTCFKRV